MANQETETRALKISAVVGGSRRDFPYLRRGLYILGDVGHQAGDAGAYGVHVARVV